MSLFLFTHVLKCHYIIGKLMLYLDGMKDLLPPFDSNIIMFIRAMIPFREREQMSVTIFFYLIKESDDINWRNVLNIVNVWPTKDNFTQ